MAHLGINTCSYSINNDQPVRERHNSTIQALPAAKAIQPKQVNLQYTPEPQYNVGDKVLLATNNIYINNVLHKMKHPWLGPCMILLIDYICTNDTVDLSSNLDHCHTCNTLHISNIKIYVNNNSILFPQCQLVKPGPVAQDRCKVKKVIEYYKPTRTGML